jgi:hypothetical protein
MVQERNEESVFASVDNHRMHVFMTGVSDGMKLVFLSGSGTVSPVHDFKVLLDQKQDDSRLPEELRDRFYRIQSNDHFCFYGEIVASYMIEP